jgi:N-acetyl-gamma-glutamyl-phosphate reductase
MEQARALLDAGVKVIDLAADFRLKDPKEFERWYGTPHTCTDLLSQAVYGLPEVNREAIRAAKLIGLPGCYPTSVQLGLMPVLEHGGLVDTKSLIADCKSGVSGAGRKAELGILMAEASDNFKAYAVTGHRHWPEITQGLKAIATTAGKAQGANDLRVTFVPHLTPMIRGIHSTIYARVLSHAQGFDFQRLFEERFALEPFVDVLPAGSHPETRSVRASNFVRIAVHRPPESDLLVILVVEDNLVKGASGQAIQCMNIMFGLPETAGLTDVPVMP